MNISKVKGTIEEHRGKDGGRIKVISFKSNGVYINDLDEIKNHFPPYGFVFSPHLFKDFPFKLNSLIEFSASPISITIENGDEFIMDRQECKLTGFPVFKVSENILINKFSINPELLRNYVQEESSHFYIENDKLLYGPFKSANDEIIPKTGTEVNTYDVSEVIIYTSGDSSYLLKQPSSIIDKIDCMTTSQLGNWFKTQIRNQQLNIDLNSLRKALESKQLQGLDTFRMDRMFSDINQIYLSISELKALANSSEKLEKLYLDSLIKADNELKEELIEPLNQQRAKLESEISKLEQKVEKCKKDEANTSKKLEIIKEQFELILKEKDRLINDIRVHTLVDDFKSTPEKLLTYEEQVYKVNGEPFLDLNEFITVFESSTENEEKFENYAAKIIQQFNGYRCFLSDNISSIIQIAKLSNNCKVIIQQVEPDWLKFERFYENSLKQVWESSYADNTILHFLILEDINMASIECYGKPILDILSGIRYKLPGINTGWPDNLWIFGIPLSIDDDYKFGLPLIKRTYEYWGFFPKVKSIKFQSIETSKFLQSEKFLGNNSIDSKLMAQIFSPEYFSE